MKNSKDKTRDPASFYNLINFKLFDFLTSLKKYIYILTAVLGLGILSAWALPLLGAVYPGNWMAMQSNTSLLVLLALANTSLRYIESRKMLMLLRSSILLTGALLVINSAWLHYSNSPLTFINNFLVHTNYLESVAPVSIQSLLSLTLLLIIPVFNDKKYTLIYDYLCTAVYFLFIYFITGYLFNSSLLIAQSDIVLISPPTLSCIFLLLWINLIEKNSPGFYTILIGNGNGAVLIRIWLPFIIVFLILSFLLQEYFILNDVFDLETSLSIIAASVTVIFSFALIILARKIDALEYEVNLSAIYDELTGILNRRGFNLIAEQSVKDAKRKRYNLMMYFFDIDGLKQVNDTLGHNTGSELIKDFSLLLKKGFRSNDVVARLSGDEFVVLAIDADGEPNVIDRLYELSQSITDKPYKLEFSVGNFRISPTDNSTIDEIIEQADQLMYQHKARRKSKKTAAVKKHAPIEYHI